MLVIGLDSGGSKTEACLARPAAGGLFHALATATTGPGNPRSVGFQVAIESIGGAMRQCLQQVRIEPQQVEAMCLAVAGAARQEEQAALTTGVRDLGFTCPIRFVHDGWAALAAAFPDAVGIALIAGTGSFGFGRNLAGDTARSGGWGAIMGDEGSGYDVARRALRAVTRAADGRGPETLLTEYVRAYFQIGDISELVPRVHAGDMDRRKLAQLTKIVFAAADQDDSVACELVSDAAAELGQLALNLVERLKFPYEYWPLGVAGGMITQQPRLQQLLVQYVQDLGANPQPFTVVTTPVHGAVRLAARFLLP